MLQTGDILFGRVEPGVDHVPSVRVLEGDLRPRFEVLPTGQVYETKRSLVIALTGHPTGRNWTFDRYFGLGKHATPQWGEGDLGDVLGFGWGVVKIDRTLTVTHEVQLLDVPAAHQMTVPPSTVSKAKAAPVPMTVPVGLKSKLRPDLRPTVEQVAKRVAEQNGVLGIDLAGRADEVAKLLFSGFGSWIYSSGYDPEDVLQEVYKGMLTRNAGGCPWEASKSSFGHYVHMVCHGVVSNFHRKQKRIREVEQLGIPTLEDGFATYGDLASASLPAAQTSEAWSAELDSATQSLLKHIQANSGGALDSLVCQVLPLLRDGHTKSEISELLSVPRSQVSRAVETIQTHAEVWRESGV